MLKIYTTFNMVDSIGVKYKTHTKGEDTCDILTLKR